MSFPEIALRMGRTLKAVQSDYSRAMKKIKSDPKAVEGLIEWIYAVAMSEREMLQARSLECRQEFVRQWAMNDDLLKPVAAGMSEANGVHGSAVD